MSSHAKAPTGFPAIRQSTSKARLGLVGSLLLCLGILFSAAAATATAAPTAQPGWSFFASFGAGEGMGVSGNFGDSIATDSHGNIFSVMNGQAEEVKIFAPDGALGGVPLASVTTEWLAPNDIAIDPNNDDLYVQGPTAEIAAPIIRRYVSDGAPVPTYTQDPTFGVPSQPNTNSGVPPALAVDPTTGDLLVSAEEGHEVLKYAPGGTLLQSIPMPRPISGLAAAPDGSFWALVKIGQSSSLDPLPPLLHISGTGTIEGEMNAHVPDQSVRSITVDPSTGGVVLGSRQRIKMYTPSGELVSETASPTESTGLAIAATSGNLYQWNGGDHNGGEINAYVPAVYPGVEVPVVTNITPESMHVSAEVEPGSGPPAGSEVWFEYSVDGGQTWSETAKQAVAGAESVATDITGLVPNKKYEVRAVAGNSLTSHTTAPVNVTTAGIAPLTETGAATDLTETTAFLNGTINTIGLQTTYHFEYGLTTDYGSRIPVGAEAVAGNGYMVRAFAREVEGLQPGTTYHFRLVATNAAGTNVGADRTFTTLSAGGIPHRTFEQVTPAEKEGRSLSTRYGFMAQPSGDGFVYNMNAGPESAVINTLWATRRSSTDWEGATPTDPPFGVGPTGITAFLTLAVSEDFKHAFVVTNKALTPGSIEGSTAANLYIVDLETGAYQHVASSDATQSEVLAYHSAINSFTGTAEQNKFVAAAADMSWVLFYSNAQLLPGAPQTALYRWSESGGLEVASMLPNGAMSKVELTSPSLGVRRFASADGSRIYYAAVGGAEEGVFLREGTQAPKPVSVSDVAGEPSGPQPALFEGTSKDGRYAFIANMASGVKLTGDATGERGDLYRYDAVTGSLEYLGVRALPNIQFVPVSVSNSGDTIYFDAATSSLGESGELSVWRKGKVATIEPKVILGSQAFASPDGRYLAYYSDTAINLYDAETGETSCASCLPNGTPVAAQLPNEESGIDNRRVQAVDNSGTVYFDTLGRLVAADVNGTQDVYAYRAGTAWLISPGDRPYAAAYQDMSENGSDIFFTTGQKLVGRDNDETVDVYDARVGSGLPVQNPPPPQVCLRDDCKSTPDAGPELPFGGSESLSGPGNVQPKKNPSCGKGKHAKKVKGKQRCVKTQKVKKAKKKKKKSQKRAHHGQGQNR
ncbi:MAG TPA: hypothetical protein VMF55_08290 [Solirubrobacterales bacterium]|nr:hypothetical protein [Solirubrobacterales bacterium]